MNAPAVTPVQVIAAVAALLGLLVSLAVLDETTSQAILAAASVLVPFAFLVADAIIRAARAKAIGYGAEVVDGKLVSPRQAAVHRAAAELAPGGELSPHQRAAARVERTL